MSRGRRLAALLLVAGVVYAVVDLWRRAPREVHVTYRWGDSRHGLRAATIRYLREGVEVRRVRFRYAGDTPYQQTHTTRLSRGPHDVRLRLETDRGAHDVQRTIDVGDGDDIAVVGPW